MKRSLFVIFAISTFVGNLFASSILDKECRCRGEVISEKIDSMFEVIYGDFSNVRDELPQLFGVVSNLLYILDENSEFYEKLEFIAEDLYLKKEFLENTSIMTEEQKEEIEKLIRESYPFITDVLSKVYENQYLLRKVCRCKQDMLELVEYSKVQIKMADESFSRNDLNQAYSQLENGIFSVISVLDKKSLEYETLLNLKKDIDAYELDFSYERGREILLDVIRSVEKALTTSENFSEKKEIEYILNEAIEEYHNIGRKIGRIKSDLEKCSD
ncbi:MAG: hypothetical protein LBI95_01230 [Holosporales bacterium]|jgi:hypothetical protein|nr:hypothetical protein [Holosporales bacterium]